jgi:hypothetical protein
MGDAGNEFCERKVDWELEFARLEVNVTFAYWLSRRVISSTYCLGQTSPNSLNRAL